MSSPKRNSKLNILPSYTTEEQVDSFEKRGRFPAWLHKDMPRGKGIINTGQIVADNRIFTVCEEAKCPNLTECWSKKTATFLAMGKECSRSCGFCDVDFNKNPKPLSAEEPASIANAVKLLGLKHVVITMVARDDLTDGGSSHLKKIVAEVRRVNPGVTLELLTSDFMENLNALEDIIEIGPEIFNHNIETVKELTSRVRHKATYQRSLAVLDYVNKRANNFIKIKSGLMVGLGETADQVKESIQDLKKVGCDIVTIGQYLQPNRRKLLVKQFVPPSLFKEYEDFGYQIGISFMHCGPFVRSSYNAHLILEQIRNK